MATTEAEFATELQLVDLLQRVEALEEADAKRIEKKNKLTIIAWGGDLDRIWPTTILATTAAASGMEASVFFTFWGLFAIVKPGVRVTGTNWMQKMMSVMNPGSAEKAKLSRYQFAGAGPAMFKKLADDHHVAAVELREGEKPTAIEEDDDRLQSGEDEQQRRPEAGDLERDALPMVHVQGHVVQLGVVHVARHRPDALGLLARQRLAQQQVVLGLGHPAQQWPDDRRVVAGG